MESGEEKRADPVVAAVADVLCDPQLTLSARSSLILAAAIHLQREPESEEWLPGLVPSPARSWPGHLITFEGMDGVGKSTVIEQVAADLESRDIEVVRMREPGGTPAGERIREILLYKLDYEIAPRAEAALFAAARAENAVQIIRPALERGAFVLSDRFVHSSIAYQGLARGLGAEAVAELSRYALNGIWPSRTLMLTLTPAEAEERRGGRRQTDAKSNDRIERAGDGFQRLVAEGFAYCVKHDPAVVEVSAAGSPDQVAARALTALADLLP